jgi:hypothetical protein
VAYPFFGNAKGGTPLMQSVQTVGIDLPLKALVWQDGSGTTWLSFNDPRYLAKRHGHGREVEAAVTAMAAAVDALAKAAAKCIVDLSIGRVVPSAPGGSCQDGMRGEIPEPLAGRLGAPALRRHRV